MSGMGKTKESWWRKLYESGQLEDREQDGRIALRFCVYVILCYGHVILCYGL
jgi:hypothetical protein